MTYSISVNTLTSSNDNTSSPTQFIDREKNRKIAKGKFVQSIEITSSLDSPLSHIVGSESTSDGPDWQLISNPLKPKSPAKAVLEIRRRSGLTWEEIAKLFNVSRRSVHSWANGSSVSLRNKLYIEKMWATICQLDRGERRKTYAFLNYIDPSSGVSKLDQLKNRNFGEALANVNPVKVPIRNRIPLSQKAKDALRPIPQMLLLDLNSDRIEKIEPQKN